MIKKAAGYGKGRKGKNLNFFFKTALCCRFEPLMYFTFTIIPGVSEFSLKFKSCLKLKRQNFDNEA